MSLTPAPDSGSTLAVVEQQLLQSDQVVQGWDEESVAKSEETTVIFSRDSASVDINIKGLFSPNSELVSFRARSKRSFSLISPASVPYFEVTFESSERTSSKFYVGILEPSTSVHSSLRLIPGLAQNSFGLVSDGSLYHNGEMFMPPDASRSFSPGDRVGCGACIDSFHQWRPFFTVNGRLLPVFTFWSIPRVMECFPAAAVPLEGKFALRGHFSGPFMFNPSESMIQDTAPEVDYFNQLPNELIRDILVRAASTPLKVSVVFGTVNKIWNQVSADNVLWREIYLQRWPRQNPGLNARSWKKMYRRRVEVERTSAHKPDTEIENCSFEYRCPVQWNYLAPIDDVSPFVARFCDRCNKTVHAVSNETELKRMYQLGNCVAVVPPLVQPAHDTGVLLGILDI